MNTKKELPSHDEILELHPGTSAVKYADYLLVQAKKYEGTRSGKRTKLLLLASAAQLFETVPPQEMRVSDICKGANTSQGTFYLYFEAKTDVIYELLDKFVTFEAATMPLFDPVAHPFENVLELVHWYEASFQLNFGVMLYLVRLSDDYQEIAEIWRRRSKLVVDRVLQWLVPKYGLVGEDTRHVQNICYLVGSMLDESLFTRLGVRGAAQSSQQSDPVRVTELQAVLIYRSVFGDNPPEKFLTRGNVFLPLIQIDRKTGESS